MNTSALEPPLHSLVLAKVAVSCAAWSELANAIATARERGDPRSGLEETLLQAVLFYGFPRAVSAFEVLQREWPVAQPPQGGALPHAEQRAAGRALFDAIYGRNQNAVHALLASFHGEFHDFVLEAAYGRILTRPGLSPRERELLAAAALAALGQIPQLVAHSRGALHFGARPEELLAVLGLGGLDGHAAAQVLARARGTGAS